MKIKVAFVTRKMVMGGIERSLIELLRKIPKDQFDVTLLVMSLEGELMKEIPEQVKVRSIFGDETTLASKIWGYIRQGKLLTAFRAFFYTILIKRLSEEGFTENMYYSKMLPFEDVTYDLAIAYHIPASLPVIYVSENIQARKKVAWLHSDVTEFGQDIMPYQDIYDTYHYIFGVSQHTVQKFLNYFPHLKPRTSIFYNLLDQKSMQSLAFKQASYHDEFTGIRILTVGRLEMEKGQDLIPKVLSRLVSQGVQVRWYCIGEGGMQDELKRAIQAYNLENHLILLGTKDNPYPYIKDCDIYVQPSRHEAYCITVAEARAFQRPIITTNTGASEQIQHGKTGLIVDFDEQQMYQAVHQLVTSSQLRKKMSEELKSDSVDTTEEMNKFYQIAKEV